MRRSHSLNSSLQKQIDQTFIQVLTEINNTDQSSHFISGFFTSSEKDILTKRFAIAYWLKKGRSYSNIKQNLKVSSATIAKVQEMMKSPGFEEALKRLETEEWATTWATRIQQFVHK